MKTDIKNLILTPFNILYRIAPKTELKLMYRLKQGHRLDLEHPKYYTEKLQWIKLHDRNEWITKCCDKYAVREYVEKMGCGELLNTLYWQGTDPDQIPYDSLPDRFVIKATHGSTFNIIVRDKSELDRKEVSKKLRRWLKAKFIPCYGEWFYGVEPPRIVVEQFLQDGDSEELLDYKVFCFNGKAMLFDIHGGRAETHYRNLYDLDWNFLEDVRIRFPHSEPIPKPALLDDLVRYAEKLSAPFYHARVDFFIVNNRIYFGELTFTNGAGFSHITPKSFDEKMGSWMKLPCDEDAK